MITDRGAGGYRSGGPSEAHRETARLLLEDSLRPPTPTARCRSGAPSSAPSRAELGFSYRNGSLMIKYRTEVNAAEGHPDTAAAASELMELDDHTPLPTARTTPPSPPPSNWSRPRSPPTPASTGVAMKYIKKSSCIMK